MSTLSFASRSRGHYCQASTILLLLISLVNAQGLPAIISYSIMRFSECTSFVNTCPPTRTSCASYICQQCTSVGYKAINSCCLQSDPAACLQTYVATANGGSLSASSPASTSITLDAYGSACVSLENIFSSCQSQTPGFTDLDDHDAASCLCYSSKSWIPNVFDKYAYSCATFYNEYSDYSDASVYSAANNFCSSVGNILGAASVSASTTASSMMMTTSAQSASAAATPSSGGSSPSTIQSQTSATATPTPTHSSGVGNQKVSLGMIGLAWVLTLGVTLQLL